MKTALNDVAIIAAALTVFTAASFLRAQDRATTNSAAAVTSSTSSDADGAKIVGREFELKHLDADLAAGKLRGVLEQAFSKPNTAITPDRKSNKLVVRAQASDMPKIESLMAALIEHAALNQDADKSSNEIKVFELQNTKASTLAQQLSKLAPTAVIVPDDRTNSIVVRASADDATMLDAIAMKLDGAEAKNLNNTAGGSSATLSMPPAAPARVVGGATSGGGLFGGGGAQGGGGFGRFPAGAISIAGGSGGRAIIMDGKNTMNADSAGSSGASESSLMPKHSAEGDSKIASDLNNDLGEIKRLDLELINRKKEFNELNATAQQLEKERQAMEIDLKRLADSGKENSGEEASALHDKLKQVETEFNLAQQRQHVVEAQQAMAQGRLAEAEKQFQAAQASQHQAMQRFQELVAPWDKPAGPMVVTNSATTPFYFSNGKINPIEAENERKIRDDAAQVRALSAAGDDQLTKEQRDLRDKTKQELRKLLDEQFNRREKSNIDELKQLHERLDKLEKEISDRSKDRESIIDRRLNDLLSADAKPAIHAFGNITVTANGNGLQAGGMTIKSDQLEFQPATVTLVPTFPAPAAVPAAPGAAVAPAPAAPAAAPAVVDQPAHTAE